MRPSTGSKIVYSNLSRTERYAKVSRGDMGDSFKAATFKLLQRLGFHMGVRKMERWAGAAHVGNNGVVNRTRKQPLGIFKQSVLQLHLYNYNKKCTNWPITNSVTIQQNTLKFH